MFQIYQIFLLVLLSQYYCSAFKIYFDQEDTWEDYEDAFRETQYKSIQWIFPGTKWCGTGNIAENENDLGTNAETDVCCRDHDLCDDTIEAGQTKYNLTNNSFYTRLNCKCDLKFYNCLKDGNTKTSTAVGNIYFNVLHTQCYRYDYPIKGCRTYRKFANVCVEYEYDTSAPKLWQWFDVPPYKGLKITYLKLKEKSKRKKNKSVN